MTQNDVAPRENGLVRQFMWTILISALVAFLLVLTAYLTGGKFLAEKVLTRLTMPLPAVWLGLGAWVAHLVASGSGRSAILPGLFWIVLTICSSGPSAGQLTRSLEQSVESYLPEQEGALDFLVVLGGGTSEGPHRAEANAGGDRVLYAAQLYHQGHVGKLITTGQAITSLVGSDARDPAEQTVEVWTRLGIPPEAIVQLPGRNTFEEMQAIKKFYESDDGGGELGILTSATHLPRAMRLAKSQGLESARGLAANHRYRAGSVSWFDYLPSAAALDQWGRCQHEYMAKLVGR